MLFYVDDYPDYMDEMLNEAYATIGSQYKQVNFDKAVWEIVKESEDIPHIGNASVLVIADEVFDIAMKLLKIDDDMKDKLRDDYYNVDINGMASKIYFDEESYNEFDILLSAIEEVMNNLQ